MNNGAHSWYVSSRMIEWDFVLGVVKRKPLISGSFYTSLYSLDFKGEYWGDTYIKNIGQHFDEYSHWNDRQGYHIVGRPCPWNSFGITPFVQRKYKDAASGVTGLIGEVLTALFLQKQLNLKSSDIAHIKPINSIKSPDLITNVNSNTIISFLNKNSKSFADKKKINALKNHVQMLPWDKPFPIECKSRRGGKSNTQKRDALKQLVSYWKYIGEMAGYGIIAQTDVVPSTKITFHLLLPKSTSEINNIANIIEIGSSSDVLSDDFKMSEFKQKLGECFYV